jgi:phytanoyl-CoA hydroxylase
MNTQNTQSGQVAQAPIIGKTMHERAEVTHHPFASWKNGTPQGYFKPGDPKIAEFFKENGFVVIEDGFSSDEVAALHAETVNICRGTLGFVKGVEPDTTSSEDDVLRRYLCIHFPHKISQLMHNTLTHPSNVGTMTQVIGKNVKCMQSMLFIKASGKPGQAWHQDEYYIPTRDRSLTGAWIALDDATVENGCLWVIPGSHKHGILWPQHQQRDNRFDCAGEATFFPYNDDDAVAVEVKRGTMVVFNGYLLHRSLPNYATSGYRRALVNHFMSAESLLPWARTDDGQISYADYRDIVMIAGQDPYHWKGIEERAAPHVRASGEGGCGNIERNAEALLARNMVLLEDDHDDHVH